MGRLLRYASLVLAFGWIFLWLVVFARPDSLDLLQFAVITGGPILFVFGIDWIARSLVLRNAAVGSVITRHISTSPFSACHASVILLML